MNAQSWRLVRKIACGALSLGLIAGAPVFVAGAQAQTAIVDPNAASASASSHDAALAAAKRGDYVSALDLSKKAAAEGHPLDADQVDFISGKAAKQQAAAADAAATKAKQEEASASAEQILARQQKQYAAQSRQEADAQSGCQSAPSGAGRIGLFTSAAADAAASKQSQSAISGRITGADDPKCAK